MKKHKSFILFTVMIMALIWAAPSAMADDIVFGYTGPLSGPGAEYGEDCVNGLEMAIDEINQQGGVAVRGKNYTIRLEKMDDKVSPELAVANAQKLRKDHKAIAVFNPVATTIVPLMKINQEKKKRIHHHGLHQCTHHVHDGQQASGHHGRAFHFLHRGIYADCLGKGLAQGRHGCGPGSVR